MLRFKADVRLDNLQPQLVVAMTVSYLVCAKYDTECLINSCNDGKHSNTSLHYSGNAFDLDTHDTDAQGNRFCKFPIDGLQLAAEIQAALPPDFDVIFEHTPGNEHIHLEYQPKGNNK